jgi:hypothetical protein
MADEAIFTFTIKFARGEGDPRRVFDAASLLIDGFEELDGTLAASVDSKLKAETVLEDLQPGSLRVVLKTILEDIDEQALKDGEYKKAIGPALVRAKRMAVQALDRPEDHAKEAITELREQLQEVVEQTDVKHLPAYAPIPCLLTLTSKFGRNSKSNRPLPLVRRSRHDFYGFTPLEMSQATASVARMERSAIRACCANPGFRFASSGLLAARIDLWMQKFNRRYATFSATLDMNAAS